MQLWFSYDFPFYVDNKQDGIAIRVTETAVLEL